MKLTLVIPVYISNDLHLDFTRQTLASIHTKHDIDVLIVINYCSPEFSDALSLLAKPYRLLANPRGNILAAAWNLGLTHAFDSLSPPFVKGGLGGVVDPPTTHHSPSIKSDFCLIANNDIIFHPKCIDNLVTFTTKHPEFLLWSASQWPNLRTLADATWDQSFSLHPHFSCFMVGPQTVKSIGSFDEHFTMGYFEDNDYHTRILVSGYQAAATDTAKFYHYGSRTVLTEDSLKPDAKFHYQKNRAYFKAKWGVDIHAKAYDPPEAILKYIRKPQNTR